MASETLSFDIFANDRASETFRRLGLAASNASGDVKTLADRLGKLGTRVATARVGLEGNKEANVELDKLDQKLIRLGKRVADPNISVEGKIRALADIAAVDLAIDKLNKKHATVTIGERISKLGDAGGLAPSAGGAALALSPALIPLAAGIAAGIGAIGISFGAAALGAGAFGLLAKSALTTAGTAASAVNTAQNQYKVSLIAIRQQYALNIAAATTHAQKVSALATEQKALGAAQIAQNKAINLAYAELTPAQIRLSKAVGGMQNAWQGVQQSTTPLISGALVPWLHAVTDAMKFIKPLVTPIAALFTGWGQALSKYFSSSAGSAELQRIATAVGNFSAVQLNGIVQFFKGIVEGIVSLAKDAPSASAFFANFAGDLQQWGAGFASWAKSAKARADVQGFLRYLHNNGGAVKSILSDLGKLLPGILAGASTAGQLELKAIAGFLNLIAHLPKSWQQPLVEAAGAMLLLSKTGVLKVGLKIVGAGLKWLTGGAISLGGGAGAAAEIRAAFASGGAAAAAAIRAAMTGGAAPAAGAEGAAAGGGAGLALKSLLAPLAELAIPIEGVALIFHKSFMQVVDHLGSQIYQLFVVNIQHAARTMFGEFTSGFINPLAHWFGTTLPGYFLKAGGAGWGSFLSQGIRQMDEFRHTTAHIFDGARHDIAHIWDLTWNNTIARVGRGVQDVQNSALAMRHHVANIFDGIRHDTASIWDRIWSNTVSTVRSGIGIVVSWFRGLPGKVTSALLGLGTKLWNLGHTWLTDLWNGIKSVSGGILGWFSGFIGKVLGFLGKLTGHSPSGEFYFAGQKMMTQLAAGLKSKAHVAANAAEAVARRVADAGSGVQRWAGLVREALRMEGLSPSLLGNVLYQMQTESGGNPNAINETDINFAMGDPSRGLMQVIGSTFAAYHWPGTSENIYNPLANIAAALNYARHVYGPSLMSGGMGIGSGHGYAAGSWNVPSTGPAVVHRGEMIIPAVTAAALRSGHGGGNTYNITVNVPPTANPREVARQIVGILNQGATGGVKLRTSILGPG